MLAKLRFRSGIAVKLIDIQEEVVASRSSFFQRAFRNVMGQQLIANRTLNY
jgi:hypothetical protein